MLKIFKKQKEAIAPRPEIERLIASAQALATSLETNPSVRVWDFAIELHDLNASIRRIKNANPAQDPIIEAVRADLLKRSEIGIQKYGTTLARKDLNVLDWHRHHYEELLDAAGYTKRIILELENKL